MAGWDIAAIRDRARQLAAAGNEAAARQLYREATRQAPHNGALFNSAGNFLFGIGDYQGALIYFDQALKLAPKDMEALLNRSLSLSRLDRSGDALAALIDREKELRTHVRYWAVRASIEREAGLSAAASASYDTCLALDADHQRARYGRARIALERGETDAARRFEQLLSGQQSDAHAWLGYAQVLDRDGQSDRALEIGLALNQQAPGWIDALQFVAELHWARGNTENFSDPYALAARERPDDKALILAWCEALAGVDRHAEAAVIAGDAANRLADAQDLRLAEAAYAGVAGDDDRADRIFADLQVHNPHRWLHEARHRLRQKAPDQADRLLSQVLDQQPNSVPAWALRDLAWRLMDDPRSAWLHGQDGLVQLRSAAMPDQALADIVDLLHRLHDGGSVPLGQSIRAGTQTRGALFDRIEPDIALLRQHIERMLQAYRTALPPLDSAHPLLRHRDRDWTITGSWSIRARRAGHHNEHIHQQGVISSAFYLVLPTIGVDEAGDLPGALELGRSPRDLRLGLPPLRVIDPVVGHCALFPSTLYHGTRPFMHGERMTIAFDIALKR
ncbi:Tetratricopeptide repeat-containing protein [Sphingobium sp. AP50]|uniref:2OG-Fe(II) oxygenase family protein n=1 Tax=Sphingobium sp. AP50 TaxID=1884369 RepID=UPI0008BDC1BB|nr:putative 2OG-Fe(II) oxygenase [Sphingobium sp. AP50]SEJ99433.1 Tetratricopeptide repeat-containing protein [Sphingobium sp. AP50]